MKVIQAVVATPQSHVHEEHGHLYAIRKDFGIPWDRDISLPDNLVVTGEVFELFAQHGSSDSDEYRSLQTPNRRLWLA